MTNLDRDNVSLDVTVHISSAESKFIYKINLWINRTYFMNAFS